MGNPEPINWVANKIIDFYEQGKVYTDQKIVDLTNKILSGDFENPEGTISQVDFIDTKEISFNIRFKKVEAQTNANGKIFLSMIDKKDNINKNVSKYIIEQFNGLINDINELSGNYNINIVEQNIKEINTNSEYNKLLNNKNISIVGISNSSLSL